MRGESVNLNADEAWSGNAGDMWSKAQPIVDALFQPIDQDLVDWVRPHAPRRILDVGCGAGSTLRTLTQALGVDAAGIDVSAAQLEVAEREINQKLQELTVIKQRIETLMGNQKEKQNDRIQSLVKIYEGMKAKDAARIFDTLDMSILIQVMDEMSERKSAPILAAMKPDRARAVTSLLAQQNQLPTLPQ